MPGPLRVFISSTMRDLRNERAEVCAKLGEFNFAPVNAEGLMPNGFGSWDRLTPEIESSDVFVLILGENYGWIPDSGPMAGTDKSVTEHEYDVARNAGIPILVFVKRLELGTPTDTDDARRRDAFRRQVAAWDTGFFRTEFDLAADLADKVGRALVDLVSDSFRGRQMRDRRLAVPPALTIPARGAPLALPEDLINAVKTQSAVLLLGAGVSLEAGMPSAAAFVDAMIEHIQEIDPSYVVTSSGTAFNAVATDFVSLLGQGALRALARQLVDPPYVGEPTEAHRIAARLFKTVVTTNYDMLLERALPGDDEVRVIHREASLADLAATARIFKLHGSIADPAGLVLTEGELAGLEESRPLAWTSVQQLLRTRPLVSIGSSLRDPSIVRLLESCRPEIRGWAAMLQVSAAERRRLDRWRLDAIESDANSLLRDLERAVQSRNP